MNSRQIPEAPGPSDAAGSFGDEVVDKVIRRLVPFMLLLYLVNQIDRVNISFGALTMNGDLGFTAEMFGFGAGIFFIGYFLFEVPSNLIMHRVGARLWMARIMFTWGAVSVGMIFVGTPLQFYVMRFLLGLAEAGFVPGMFLYLTYWVPAKHRGRALGLFILAAPLTPVVAGPISTMLLELNGLMGLKGWQWLYLVEGIPAVLLAFATLAYLTDRPSGATWLSPSERAWLDETLEAERAGTERAGGRHTLLDGLRSPLVLLFGAIYIFFVIGLYGVAFWLPQIVRGFGLSNLQVGFVVAIPYFAGAIACVVWPKRSDQRGERRWHFILPCLVSGAAFVASAILGAQWLALVPITIAVAAIYAALPVFWTLPNMHMTGLAAASGIAFINSIGNLGGFAGPYLVGWLRETTGSFTLALLSLSLGLFVAGVLALLVPHQRSREADAELALRLASHG
ncbi:MFS transporter [Ancylobacter pratisalsi]|uniref:MFS transporter n=1 Tax=Ancylobacter pratisalsi TaxID=1745854 RepID=A0A6P1YK78_9HYPH|nr:MFS transporter [Ancylobacter pratisalsi]QIB33116.1 MFS transporter [Ancylobacter pratisalsi]